MPVKKQATVDLHYRPYIQAAPISNDQLYERACVNDKITVDSWKATWIKNYKENHKRFGPFKDKSIGKLHNAFNMKPCILAGSGPSLKKNIHLLKDRPQGICLISCLHNFHAMEDAEANVDFYVTLDSGLVVIDEVTEGGKEDTDYWAKTKGKKLLAFVSSPPELLEKWQGEIYFFNCPIPQEAIVEECEKTEMFRIFISTGGNVLGASMVIALSILGCMPIAFVGADFSFSYDSKFHSWDSKYDASLGHTIEAVDVFGMLVKTWPSYHGFKGWFDMIAQTKNMIVVNCTEGGTFGAYPQGNIMSIRQMDLVDYMGMFRLSEGLKPACENPEYNERLVFL